MLPLYESFEKVKRNFLIYDEFAYTILPDNPTMQMTLAQVTLVRFLAAVCRNVSFQIPFGRKNLSDLEIEKCKNFVYYVLKYSV